MKKLLGILALSTLFVACKKSDSSDGTTPAAEQYMNYNNGSSWSYLQTNNATSVVTGYTLTSTNRDSTINGRSYHVFNNSNGTRAFYNKTGNDYYQFDTVPGGLATGMVERLYLKDNLALGLTWTQTINISISGIPVAVTATNTVTEKDVTRIVNGISYANVIHVKTVLSLPPGLGVTLTSDLNSYYGKKVGLIESSNLLTVVLGGFTQTTNNKTILVSSTLM